MGKAASTKTSSSTRASSEVPTPRSTTPARSETPTVAGQQEKFEEDDDVDTLTRKFHDFTMAEELQSHNINMSDITKVKDAGWRTVGLIHAATKKDLLKIKGLSETKVDKLKTAVDNLLFPNNEGRFVTGNQRLDQRKNCLRLSTGSSAFDAMLGGGFETGSICEVFGEYRCGKTQICHTVSVVAQLPVSLGGGEGKVAYIDTENTFRPERIRHIAERFGVDPDLANDNIITVRIVNSDHQHETIFNLIEQLATGDFRVVIMDSIMAKFRVDYSGRGELSERQQFLGKHLNLLTLVAAEFNVLVLMTNQVQSDPGAMAFAGADGRKAVGGHVLAHASTTRVLLRKGRGEERVAKVQDSPDVAEGEATYVITKGGIDDPSSSK